MVAGVWEGDDDSLVSACSRCRSLVSRAGCTGRRLAVHDNNEYEDMQRVSTD